MFVAVKNNMPDATAVVAFTHIPPGETRNVEQTHYTKWFQGGGHRLLDAGMITEVLAQAKTAPTVQTEPTAAEAEAEACSLTSVEPVSESSETSTEAADEETGKAARRRK